MISTPRHKEQKTLPTVEDFRQTHAHESPSTHVMEHLIFQLTFLPIIDDTEFKAMEILLHTDCGKKSQTPQKKSNRRQIRLRVDRTICTQHEQPPEFTLNHRRSSKPLTYQPAIPSSKTTSNELKRNKKSPTKNKR